jgi:hypothetical protein
MCSNNDNLKNEIEKFRAILNKLSLNLLKNERRETSQIISVSKKVDNLINELMVKEKK